MVRSLKTVASHRTRSTSCSTDRAHRVPAAWPRFSCSRKCRGYSRGRQSGSRGLRDRRTPCARAGLVARAWRRVAWTGAGGHGSGRGMSGGSIVGMVARERAVPGPFITSKIGGARRAVAGSSAATAGTVMVKQPATATNAARKVSIHGKWHAGMWSASTSICGLRALDDPDPTDRAATKRRRTTDVTDIGGSAPSIRWRGQPH